MKKETLRSLRWVCYVEEFESVMSMITQIYSSDSHAVPDIVNALNSVIDKIEHAKKEKTHE